MKTYNIGLVGFGLIGRVHAYGYDNLKYYYPDSGFGAKLFGVCGRRRETVEEAKKSLGFSYGTTDYRELINHPDVDVIDICTPNNLHKEQLLEALKAGKPVYCEKPLVCDMNEAEAISEALRDFKKTHQVAFHNRFFPASLKAKDLIVSEGLGEIISYRIAYYHSGSLDAEKPMGWKQEKGAGVLLDLGSHAIDLIYFFLGEFKEVAGREKTLYPERKDRTGNTVKVDVEDYFIINAGMKNGAMGVIEASKIAAGAEDELKYEIYGTKGALRYNSMHPNYLEFFNSDEKEAGFKSIPTVSRYPEGSFPGPKFSVGWTRAHIHSIYSFLKCIDEGKSASPSFYDGLYNMQVIESARISSLNNKIQPVNSLPIKQQA
ncbi:MAG: Gfo/Idh/MocA family oxidoreductase [Candidatus Omnitrophica bacterium]|nr:Gfo/Idh/MocA family oxidoreductase [Candidatus Omnitrophota bacterium]